MRTPSSPTGELFRQEGIELALRARRGDLPSHHRRPGAAEAGVLQRAGQRRQARRLRQAHRRLHEPEEDELQVVRVRDYGPGIPAAELPYRSRNSTRAPPRPAGSGIGLAVCDEIVRLHGGTFDIGNAEGGGAVVTICLPGRRMKIEQMFAFCKQL
ncbi:MAG: sensor histidine kinase [Dysosmobacter sp.]